MFLLYFVIESVFFGFVAFFIFAWMKVIFGTRIIKTLNPLYLKDFADYAYNLKGLSKGEKERYIRPFESFVIAFISKEMTDNPIKRFKCNRIMRESREILRSDEFQKLAFKVSYFNPIGCGSSLFLESLILGNDEKMISSKMIYLKKWYRA